MWKSAMPDHDGKMIVAADTVADNFKGSPKQYCHLNGVKELTTLIWTTHESLRCFYIVIDDAQSSFPFFDIDGAIPNGAVDYLQQFYGIAPSDLYVLEACGNGKLSYHIHCRTKRGYSLQELKATAELLGFDTAVYRHRGCFRLPYSTKVMQARPLLPTYNHPDDWEVFCIRFGPQSTEKRPPIENKTTESKPQRTPTARGTWESDLAAINIAFPCSNIRTLKPSNNSRSNFREYLQFDSRYCPLLSRNHKSTYGVYIVTDTECICQCFSNDCHGKMLAVKLCDWGI